MTWHKIPWLTSLIPNDMLYIPPPNLLVVCLCFFITVLPCFYIYTQEEKLLRKATPESSELQTAINEYEKNHEDDSNGESYEEEKYEYDSTLHADRTYLKFKKRMDAYPEQCFRWTLYSMSMCSCRILFHPFLEPRFSSVGTRTVENLYWLLERRWAPNPAISVVGQGISKCSWCLHWYISC